MVNFERLDCALPVPQLCLHRHLTAMGASVSAVTADPAIQEGRIFFKGSNKNFSSLLARRLGSGFRHY